MHKLLFAVALIALLAACTAAWAVAPDVQKLLDLAPKPSAYPNDAQARVVDFAEYTMHPDGSITEHVHTVVMVLNERGRDGGEAIDYVENHQTVKIITARTIKASGEVVDVAPGDIHTTSVFAGYDLYEDFKRMRFTYPALEDGALMDFEYERTTRDPLLPNYFGFTWSMQGSVPQMGSELIVHKPLARKFEINTANHAPKFREKISEDNKMKTLRWVSGTYPAIESEPYMPSETELVPWVSFSPICKWDDVAAVVIKGVQGKADPDEAITKAAAEIVGDAKDDVEKLRRIDYWLQSNMNDVGASLILTRFDPKPAPEVYRKRYGNGQAIVGLMIAMLKSVGIEARWAFPGTSKDPKDAAKEDASFDTIDDCLCYVKLGDKAYWIDPVSECYALGDMPSGYFNSGAMVLKPGGGYEFMATPERKDDPLTSISFLDADVLPNGDATVRVSQVAYHDNAASMKLQYKYAQPDKIKEGFQGAAQQVCASGKLIDYQYPDWTDFEGRARVAYTLFAPGWARTAGGYLMVRPNASQTSSGGGDPFPEKERKYDIVFGGGDPSRTIFMLTIPEGYEIESLPKDYEKTTPYAKATIKFTVEGRTIVAWNEWQWLAARLDKSKLPEVRQFLLDAGKRGRDTIVLKKKKE